MRGPTSICFALGVVLTLGVAGWSGAATEDADNGTTVAPGAEPGTEAGPWVTLPPNPEGVSRPAGAVVGGMFYVIGGESTGGARFGYVQEYDPIANTWDNTLATMPIGISNGCAAVIGTDIFVPGGWDGVSYLGDLQVYHTTTDTWEMIATDPLPVGASGAACTATGGLVYVVGGNTAGGYTAALYAYDPAAAAGTRWTTLAPAPIAAGYGDAVPGDGGIFYAGMRDAAITDMSDVLWYDPGANTWTAYPSLNTARAGARLWVYDNWNTLGVGGGGWSSYLTSCEEYDLSAGTGGTWTAGNPLNTGRRTFAAAQDDVDGYLYVGAGWAGVYLANAEQATFVIPVELESFTVE